MIYLIGGPPRCGKTTLAKRMSKKFGIPWISTDTLEVVSGEYMTQKQWNKSHPYSVLRHKLKTNDEFYNKLSAQKIISVLQREACATFPAIEMTALCEIKDGNDYIIEGYHIVPSFAQKMIKKCGKKNVRAIFLAKFDANKFAQDVHKSTTPNDWLIVLTKKQETFIKVGKMVSLYSRYFEKEAKKFGLRVFNTDVNFDNQINNAIKYLI